MANAHPSNLSSLPSPAGAGKDGSIPSRVRIGQTDL